ncbi:MAG: hypothetical protein ACM3ZT_10830 [Bacillota bacterium]
MKNALCILSAGALLALAACSSNDQSDQTATKAPPSGTIQVSKSNVFSPYVQDLNKAKQVNNQVQDQFKKTDSQVEAPTAATANGP